MSHRLRALMCWFAFITILFASSDTYPVFLQYVREDQQDVMRGL